MKAVEGHQLAQLLTFRLSTVCPWLRIDVGANEGVKTGDLK